MRSGKRPPTRPLRQRPQAAILGIVPLRSKNPKRRFPNWGHSRRKPRARIELLGDHLAGAPEKRFAGAPSRRPPVTYPKVKRFVVENETLGLCKKRWGVCSVGSQDKRFKPPNKTFHRIAGNFNSAGRKPKANFGTLAGNPSNHAISGLVAAPRRGRPMSTDSACRHARPSSGGTKFDPPLGHDGYVTPSYRSGRTHLCVFSRLLNRLRKFVKRKVSIVKRFAH